LAYYLISSQPERVDALTSALQNAKAKVKLCAQCFTYTENTVCETCARSDRLSKQICVVDRPSDVRAIEASGKFKGTYHVLHGLLSPVDGVGPEQIKVTELLKRMQSWDSMDGAEVILALNPSVEGEATALYITRLLKPFHIKISKIAYGLPMGGSLEYADRGTIGRALDNRTEC
jgi:recombination protein RecR